MQPPYFWSNQEAFCRSPSSCRVLERWTLSERLAAMPPTTLGCWSFGSTSAWCPRSSCRSWLPGSECSPSSRPPSSCSGASSLTYTRLISRSSQSSSSYRLPSKKLHPDQLLLQLLITMVRKCITSFLVLQKTSFQSSLSLMMKHPTSLLQRIYQHES